MTEIPEHLLKRSEAARRRAMGEQPNPQPGFDPFYPRIPEHLRDRFRPTPTERYDQNEVVPATLLEAMHDIRNRFGVTVVAVPEGMPADDAQGILDVFAGMGDVSPEFIDGLARAVRRATAPTDVERAMPGEIIVWATPTTLSQPQD